MGKEKEITIEELKAEFEKYKADKEEELRIMRENHLKEVDTLKKQLLAKELNIGVEVDKEKEEIKEEEKIIEIGDLTDILQGE